MDLSSVISQMGILLAIIALGYAAAKSGALPAQTNRVLAQLVILITNPCTVLSAALSGERALSNGEVLGLTAVAAAGFAVMIGVGQALPRLLRAPAGDRNVYFFMATFSNMGFMGFPVVRALYGEGAVFYAAIFNLVFQFVVYTYGVWLLNGNGTAKKKDLWKTFVSPIILASVLAYVCYLTGWRAPAVVADGLRMVGAVTSPVSMLVIGIALARVPLRRLFTNWRIYVLCAVRLVLLPVAVFFLARLVVHNPLMLGITVVMLGMPIATLSTLLTEKYGGNAELAASGVFLSTLLSFATIPLLMWIMF